MEPKDTTSPQRNAVVLAERLADHPEVLITRYPGLASHLPPSLLRLSVGIEAVEDLWADLDRALRVAVNA